jgi:hypothetical protein
MPRFVLLEHDYPTTHWDLMLESGSVLRTWRLSKPLSAGEPLDAAGIADHRLLYLDYEGPISGNRGQVVRWDGGTFAAREWSEGRIAVQVRGERIHGLLILEKVEGDVWRITLHSTES